MRHHAALLLAILGAGYWQEAATQYYQAIYSDNGMSWRGEWGPNDYCNTPPDNSSFAYSLQFKYDDLDDLDFIGGDSVKLYCRDEDNVITGYISSLEGSHGDWQGIYSCPEDEFFIGFRLRVFPDQGAFGDDFAVDNIQLTCSDGTVVDGLDGVTPPTPFLNREREDLDETSLVRKWVEIKGRWAEEVHKSLDEDEVKLNGQWGSWAYCSPGMRVAGIRTVVEEGSIGDDAGLTDVTLFCI